MKIKRMVTMKKATYNVYDKLNELNLNSDIKIRARHSAKGYYLQLERSVNSKRIYTGTKLTLTGVSDSDRLILDKVIELRDSYKYGFNMASGPMAKATNSNVLFKDYYLSKIKFKGDENQKWYKYTLAVFLRYAGDDILLTDVDNTLLNKFLGQMTVIDNTKHRYLQVLKSILQHAVKDHILIDNPAEDIKIKMHSVKRNFLTIEDIKNINDNGTCHNEDVKKAFIFSCFVGIRKADCYNLKWTDIDSGILTIRMQKTKDVVTVKLNETALEILNSIDHIDNHIFHLPTYRNLRYNLEDLLASAGITKKITWHSSRHSFAGLLLDSGVDLYTTSRLLGHRSIQTTMIYSHIKDQKLYSAIDSLPTI
jgi:site-specific recombinase XerD